MKSKFVEDLSLRLTAPVMTIIAACTLAFLFSSCAYKLSSKTDTLPGNTHVIYLPLFKNASTEPGLEVYFTNAMKKEVLTSRAVEMVSSESKADAVLYGTVNSIFINSEDGAIQANTTSYLPYNTILNTLITVTVDVTVQLKRRGSSEVLWSQEFKQALNYTPPQVTLSVVNSENNLYNLSARRQTLDTLAQNMMQLAFDRMVDNF